MKKKLDNLTLLESIIYVYGRIIVAKEQLKQKKGFRARVKIENSIKRDSVQVKEQSKELIHALIKTSKNNLYPHLISLINEAAKSFHADWSFVISEVRKILMDTAIKDSKKSYCRRWVEIHQFKSFAIMFISGLLFFKWLWLVNVSASLSGVEGLHQRLEVFKKFNSYLEDSNTHHTRGNQFKFLINWPGKPTTRELEGLKELVELSNNLAGSMVELNQICKKNFSKYSKFDERLIPVAAIDEYIAENKDLSNETSELVKEAFEEKFKC